MLIMKEIYTRGRTLLFDVLPFTVLTIHIQCLWKLAFTFKNILCLRITLKKQQKLVLRWPSLIAVLKLSCKLESSENRKKGNNPVLA